MIVRGTSSKWSSVINGVSQGSVLGPVLSLYLNDLPLGMYLCWWQKDLSSHYITNCYDILQSDINSALQWCDVWLAFLNSSKGHHNSIGSSSSIGQYYLFSTDDNGDDITHPITTVSNKRDLGFIYLSEIWSFMRHGHRCTRISGVGDHETGSLRETQESGSSNWTCFFDSVICMC